MTCSVDLSSSYRSECWSQKTFFFCRRKATTQPRQALNLFQPGPCCLHPSTDKHHSSATLLNVAEITYLPDIQVPVVRSQDPIMATVRFPQPNYGGQDTNTRDQTIPINPKPFIQNLVGSKVAIRLKWGETGTSSPPLPALKLPPQRNTKSLTTRL